MSPSKKHPLEVFRGIGQGSESAARAWKPSAAKRKKKPPGNTSRKPTRKEVRRSPGDFKMTLTMNQVLATLLVVTILVLGGYFAGYYKGDPGTETTTLSSRAAPPDLLQDPARESQPKQPSSAGPGRKNQAQGGSWGVLLAVYNLDQKHICDETFRTLVKQGVPEKEISKVRYPKNKKYGLIIGSFDSQNDPSLITLRDQWRAYKGFPYGEPAPFESAKIARLP